MEIITEEENIKLKGYQSQEWRKDLRGKRIINKWPKNPRIWRNNWCRQNQLENCRVIKGGKWVKMQISILMHTFTLGIRKRIKKTDRQSWPLILLQLHYDNMYLYLIYCTHQNIFRILTDIELIVLLLYLYI